MQLIQKLRSIPIWGWVIIVVVLAAGAGTAIGYWVWPGSPDEGEAALESVVDTSDESGLVYRMTDGVRVERGKENLLPIGVMVDNLSPARPQSGLSRASVVYETLAEAGITRYLAVFAEENFGEVGPIRSARPYHLEWISEYDAAYVHAGGSPEALQAVKDYGTKDISALASGPYFQRVNKRRAPHNLYSNSTLLSVAVQEKGFPSTATGYASWAFADAPDAADLPEHRQEVMVNFGSSKTYNPRFVYDAATNTYARFYDQTAQVDEGHDNVPVAPTNVVVMTLPAESLFASGMGRIDLDLHGEGTVVVFRNGEAVEGMWKKADRKDRTTFVTADGEPIRLTRGQVWVVALPGNRTMMYTTPDGTVMYTGGVKK